MEIVYTWQATDSNGSIFQYEDKPTFSKIGKVWFNSVSGGVKYIGESLLNVDWESSIIEIKQDIVEYVMPETPTTVDMLFAFLKDKDIEVMQDYIQMLVDEANYDGYDECRREMEE
jgi:hypothetical protein